jgi:protein-disulfide isomerase
MEDKPKNMPGDPAEEADRIEREIAAYRAKAAADAQAPAAPGGMILNYLIVAAVFLMVGVALGLLFAPSSAEALTRADIEEVVAEALAGASFAPAIVEDDSRFELVDDDPYLGPEDAPVVIVEFSAFACPFCGRHFEGTLVPLMENYGDHVRYVYRDYPVINPAVSVPAAEAAQCAFEQGLFWEFHNELYRNQERLAEAGYLNEAAVTVGLDVDAFSECVESGRMADEVQNDWLDGQIQQITGTPAFFINGQFVSGAQPYEVFERLILRELEKLGIDPTAVTDET